MTINLYVNNSENNKVGKNLTSKGTITGTLRNDCSIIAPSIDITSNLALTSNYCYIPEFNRYYFINDVTSIRNGLFNINCKVDVLESFKSQIYENDCVLARQENLCNLYLKDDLSKFTSDTFTLFKNFPTQPINGGAYVLITTG